MTETDDHTFELLSAFLDGEVAPHERTHVEGLLETSVSYRQVYEEWLWLRGELVSLPTLALDIHFSKQVVGVVRTRETESAESQPYPVHLSVESSGDGSSDGLGWLRRGGTVAASIAATILALFVVYQTLRPDLLTVDSVNGSGSVEIASESSSIVVERLPADPQLTTDKQAEGIESSEKSTAEILDRGSGSGLSVRAVDEEETALLRQDEKSGHADEVTHSLASALPAGVMKPILVIEADLLPAAEAAHAFDNILIKAGIQKAKELNAGPQLRTTLFESRFLEDVEVMQTAALGGLQDKHLIRLVYLVASGGQIERITHALYEAPSIPRVFLNISLLPEKNDLLVFHSLRNAVSADSQGKGKRDSLVGTAHVVSFGDAVLGKAGTFVRSDLGEKQEPFGWGSGSDERIGAKMEFEVLIMLRSIAVPKEQDSGE